MKLAKAINIDQICPLCGTRKAEHNGKRFIHREHLPPRCVLTKGGNDSITIPSCVECNGGTSKNDEKFKCHLAIYLGEHTPDRRVLWDSARKTFNHKPKWRDEILASSKLLVPFPDKKLGYGYPVKLDKRVLLLAITKIVKGLHWHITQEVIPPEIEPEILLLEQGINFDHSLTDIFYNHGKSIKCGGNFEAIYAIPEDSMYASAWLIRFFGEDCFVVFIHPKRPVEKTITQGHGFPLARE